MVTDIWLLPGVLPDVHLKVRQLEVALGAPWIETDKRFALLLRLGDAGLRVDELRHMLTHLWDDERGVVRHGHLDGIASFVLVSIIRGAAHVGHYLNWEGSRRCEVGMMGLLSDGCRASLVDWGEGRGVVLQRNGCRGMHGVATGRHWGVDRCRELREVLLLRVWYHGLLSGLCARHRRHQHMWLSMRVRGVVWREVVLRYRWAGVHVGGIGWGRKLLMLQVEGVREEVVTRVVHDTGVGGH